MLTSYYGFSSCQCFFIRQIKNSEKFARFLLFKKGTYCFSLFTNGKKWGYSFKIPKKDSEGVIQCLIHMEILLSKMHCSHEGSFQGRKLGANGLHLFQHREGPLPSPLCLWALVESMNNSLWCIQVAPFTRPGDVGVWKCSPIIHCNNFVPC